MTSGTNGAMTKETAIYTEKLPLVARPCRYLQQSWIYGLIIVWGKRICQYPIPVTCTASAPRQHTHVRRLAAGTSS